MTKRMYALVALVVAAGVGSTASVAHYPSKEWWHFALYLVAVLLSSGMKVTLPKFEGTMSVNFPFILLGIVQLAPLQAIALALCSVIVLFNFRVIKPFAMVQTIFNLANVTTSVVGAWYCYTQLVAHGLELAPALALASLVYFFSNSLPITLIMAWQSGLGVVAQWRKAFLWYVPFYVVGAMIAAAADVISDKVGWLTSLLLIPLVYTIYRSYSSQVSALKEREQHLADNKALHLRTIEGLAMAIEAKDENTHQHLMRVRVYVTELAKLMDLDDDIKQALTTASFLHDIGKLAVPEHIINKPGKLTKAEFEKMKIHPVVGADILERVRFPYPVVPIVRSHHESWDGSGYPDGLKGEEIPIGARLLSAVDCFDALASDRPYRKALSLEDAMAFVKSRAGIQFDPEIVDLLSEHFQTLESKARQELSSMAPLATEMYVERGAAPGAGFEEQAPNEAEADSAGGISTASRFASLNLIAAASQEAKAVFELSQNMGSSLGVRELSTIMSQRLKPLINSQCFAIYLASTEVLKLYFKEGECADAFSNADMQIGEGLSGWVAQSGRPLLNGNPTVEQNFLAGANKLTAASSTLSIPLFDLNKDVFGVMTLYARESAAFSKDHLRVLQAVESKFSLALLNALRFSSMDADAGLDHLTKLPNLRNFLETLELQIESSRGSDFRFVIAVCDLNSFKGVNDQLGHRVGDRILQEVAGMFRSLCELNEVVARTGGDEFVFLFPALERRNAARRAEQVEEIVQRALRHLGIDEEVSASVGLAFYPEDGETSETLLGAAGRTMHLQKQAYYGEVQAQRSNAIFRPSAVA